MNNYSEIKKIDLMKFSQQQIQSSAAEKVQEKKASPKPKKEVIKLSNLKTPPQWGWVAIFDHFDQEGKRIVSVTWPQGEPRPIVLWEWK